MANNLSWLPGIIAQDESAVKLLGGTNLAFTGIETTLVDGPNLNVLHDFNVDTYGSAHYVIHAECGSDQRETLNVSVVAKLNKASIVVYGRINTGVNLVDVSADITDSILQLYATPAVPGLQNIKVTAFATLAETIVGESDNATVYYFAKVNNTPKFTLNLGPYSTDDVAPALTFYKGLSYRIDQTDSSNNNNPFVVGTTANDINSLYTVGVAYYLNGVVVQRNEYIDIPTFSAATSRYIEITVNDDYPGTLHYFSSATANLGNSITVTALSESGSTGGGGSGGSGGGGGPVTGGAAVDLSNLEPTAINQSLIPNVTSSLDLGSASNRWRDLYLSGNSIILGGATITATGTAVNLPAGSTVGGSAIGGGGGGGGSSNSFTTFRVDGQSDVVADSVNDVITLIAGSNITITTDPTNDRITINSTGSGGGGGNAFRRIDVAGQASVSADQVEDILTLVAGPNITITTNASTDTITISAASGEGGGPSGVSSGVANRLAYYATSGSVVQDTGNGLTWNGQFLQILGTLFSTGQKSYLRAYWDTLNDLNIEAPPVSWRGMVAVAGDTGKLYYANAGTWNRIANFSDIPTSANGFGRIQIDGQDTVTADIANDTMTLIAGVGMTITTNAANNSITLSSSGGGGGGGITTEDAQDAAASLFLSGTHNGITFAYNDASNSINATVTASAGIYTDEQARDAAGSLFASGSHSGINFVYDDANDRINATVSFPTPYNDENAQDAAASMLVSGSHTGISFTYQDASNRMDAAVSAEYIQDQAASLFSAGTHTGISFTYDDVGNRMNVSVTGIGVTQFSNLTDASSASLTIDKIYLPAITSLAVTNNSALAYRFDQYGSTTDNPTIYVISGTTIAFNLNVGGHPFLIQTSGGVNYNTGLVHVSTSGTVSTGAAAQGQQTGTLYWKIPYGISGNYRYICSIHGAMVGIISVKDIAAI